MLVMLLTVNSVLAETQPMGTYYDNKAPEIYFLKKGFGFCQRWGDNQIPPELGGSTPNGMDVQTAGCIEWDYGERFQTYAFSGEQIGELVVARDPNGVEDLTNAYLAVDGVERVKCIPIDKDEAVEIAEGWGYYDLETELQSVPHQTIAGAGSIPAGYNENYDKLYVCYLTITDDMQGWSDITVKVYDESGESDETDPQRWELNPAVGLDISGLVEFPQAPAGSTVYSTGKLKIENTGSIVAVAVWLGGTDLYGDVAARCPWSNVLDVDKYMQFRCTLNGGIWIDEEWKPVYNKDLTDEEGCWLPVGYDGTCFGLLPIFPSTNPVPPIGRGNILFPGDYVECEFKLEYPVPCIGTFTEGNLIILMRAI